MANRSILFVGEIAKKLRSVVELAKAVSFDCEGAEQAFYVP